MVGVTNTISVTSGCEIFRRFITLVSMDALDVEECKAKMIHRGIVYFKRCSEAQAIISKLGNLCLLFVRIMFVLTCLFYSTALHSR